MRFLGKHRLSVASLSSSGRTMAKSAVRRTSMLDNVATHLGTSCLNHQFLSWISHRVEWLVWLRGSASVPGAGCVRVQCRAESELVVGMFTMRGLTPVIIVRSGRHRPVLSGMAPCPAILTREREMRAGRDDPCKFGTNRAIGRVGGLLRLETDLAQAFEPARFPWRRATGGAHECTWCP